MQVSNENKIPVTVITGFLGAGKTTLLNHILTTHHGMKFAVIENEFGEISIDDQIVVKKQNVAEEIISLDNGCLCCTVRGDLTRVLRQLCTGEKKLDGIIIETTGMADPGPVVNTFYMEPDINARCKVDGVVTVVDAKHVMQHLLDPRSEGAVNESQQQVAFADRILLNKTDLVSEEEKEDVKENLKQINRMADIIECQKGQVDPKHLININKFDLERVLEFDPEFLKEKDDEHDHSHSHDNCDDKECGHESHSHGHDHAKKDDGHSHGHDHAKKDDGHSHGHDHAKKDDGHSHGHDHAKKDDGHSHGHDHKKEDACTKEDCHDKGHAHAHEHKKPKTRHDMAVSSVGIALKEGEDMDLKALQHWIGQMLQEKAMDLFRYKGIIAVKGFDQKFVFQGVHELFDGDFMGEWAQDEKRLSKFVFIGKNLKREELEEGFRACIAKPLRFNIGDQVEARVKGGFKVGTVVKQWDQGNPYRIKLETGVEVFGPMDDNRVVRPVGFVAE